MKTSLVIARSATLATGLSLLFSTASLKAEVYSGPAEVVVDGTEAMKETPDEIANATEWNIQAGGVVAGGNTKSAAGTAGSRFMLRRGRSELAAILAANYARSGTEDSSGLETTMENYQGRVRYDYFWTRKLSSFLAVQARRDRFQGLNLRLGVDPGLSYFFLRRESLRLWTELGYDFQYDVLTQETLDLAETEGTQRDRTETDHNFRAYLGYEQRIDDRLKVLTGLELYKSFVYEPSYRINWTTEVQTQLVDSFSLAIGSTAMYNNAPLPGVKKFDVTSSVNFVYTFL